jgi:two-component system OmpR family sensor kinase
VTDQLPGRSPGPAGPGEPVRPSFGEPVDPNSAPPEYWTPPPAGPSFTTLGEPVDVIGPADEQREPDEDVRRRWMGPRTLTSRLVVGVVALVVMVVVASGFATYAALGSFLTDRLDQQVANTAGVSLTGMRNCVRNLPASCPIVLSGPGTGGTTPGQNTSMLRASDRLWVALLDPSGAAVPLVNYYQNPDLTFINPSAELGRSLVSDANHYQNLSVDGASIRVAIRPVATVNGGTYYEVMGLTTDEVTNTLHQLLIIELIIGVSAVLIAFLATSFGVRLSLRPLHRVTNTARAVTAELSPEGAGLDRRVPVNEAESDTEVGQLAESVNTLLGAVETQFAARVESDQRMRQFMADASHELRTPLTSIRGYAELARMRRQLANASTDDEIADEPAEATPDADALERIEAEGNRMSRLVEDLLTLARGDVGAPSQSAPVDVGELLDDAVEGAQAAYPGRRFTATTYSPMTVHGDHDELLRVIRNLLTNAAVHTAAGRPIQVTANRDGQLVSIRVIDSGPGLTPEQAAHVFERFWRSDASRARTSGGSGLGLSIVASIVAAHGGTVRFDSTVETGSVVTVTLPVQ